MTDKMIGLGFAALGIVILVLSLQLPPPVMATHIAYGAGFFPSILGVAIALAGAAMALTPAGDSAELDEADEPAEDNHWFKPALVMLAGLAYVLFAQQVGFLILAPIILTGLLLLGRVAPWRALVIGILGSVIVYVLFAKLLLVPLPLGLLTPFGAHL
jgi:putative tricarboxylic transport membrane protein